MFIDCRAELANLSERALATDYVLEVDGEPVKSEAVRLPVGGSTMVAFSVQLDDVQPWEPGTPRLYEVALRYGGDELRGRAGAAALAPQPTRRTASATRCGVSGGISGKSGRLTQVREISSVTGRSPSLNPSFRKTGCRWMGVG